jgi:hypothetical protein
MLRISVVCLVDPTLVVTEALSPAGDRARPPDLASVAFDSELDQAIATLTDSGEYASHSSNMPALPMRSSDVSQSDAALELSSSGQRSPRVDVCLEICKLVFKRALAGGLFDGRATDETRKLLGEQEVRWQTIDDVLTKAQLAGRGQSSAAALCTLAQSVQEYHKSSLEGFLALVYALLQALSPPGSLPIGSPGNAAVQLEGSAVVEVVCIEQRPFGIKFGSTALGNVVVRSIGAGGQAAKHSQLRPGAILLAIGHHSVEELSYKQTMAVLKDYSMVRPVTLTFGSEQAAPAPQVPGKAALNAEQKQQIHNFVMQHEGEQSTEAVEQLIYQHSHDFDGLCGQLQRLYGSDPRTQLAAAHNDGPQISSEDLEALTHELEGLTTQNLALKDKLARHETDGAAASDKIRELEQELASTLNYTEQAASAVATVVADGTREMQLQQAMGKETELAIIADVVSLISHAATALNSRVEILQGTDADISGQVNLVDSATGAASELLRQPTVSSAVRTRPGLLSALGVFRSKSLFMALLYGRPGR